MQQQQQQMLTQQQKADERGGRGGSGMLSCVFRRHGLKGVVLDMG